MSEKICWVVTGAGHFLGETADIGESVSARNFKTTDNREEVKDVNNPAKIAVSSPDGEKQFFADIAAILREGRNKIHAAVNFTMVRTYWQIGKRIVEQEQQGSKRAEYGEHLIKELSRYLGDNFGGGFSVANLWNFRKFYLTFRENSTHCVENLSWSHIRLLMRIEGEKARSWYLNEAREQNWSVRVLERNIKTGYYNRMLSSRKFAPSARETVNTTDSPDLIKDPYILEFLGLPENIRGSESDLESAIMEHLREFLLEMGRGFSFVGRQFRISTETSHFYVDLVFYNYLLKCFVVIDLKTQKLTHQDIGQMDMYVRMFDDLKRCDDDNPTIGIILCADKDETIVRYSVLKESRQIFASKYKLVLPTEEELTAELERNARFLREVNNGGKEL
ncbi:MAG: PDDEXK nuclease domain-containing protein [Synergistaceae bacterium]|jgi:predicted nuclease of restriction endonuclease-like (RecB) superfamily|nr:PDDEXK nuclease domain-containing protein [Synergistaceae bacterium]